MTSADGGKTWIGTFTPAVGLANGSTTITLADKSYSDNAGNLGAAQTSAAITIDTKSPVLPTVATVSTDNFLNKIENEEGFNLTGTGEANATVSVSGFLTGVKTTTVNVNGIWTLAVANGDLTADAVTILSINQSDVFGNKSDALNLKLTTDLTAPTAVLSSVMDNVGPVTELCLTVRLLMIMQLSLLARMKLVQQLMYIMVQPSLGRRLSVERTGLMKQRSVMEFLMPSMQLKQTR